MATLIGTSGADVLTGTGYQSNVISGMGGNDRWAGGNYTGSWNWVYELVYSTGGNDTLTGGAEGQHNSVAGDGIHMLYSNGGDDVVTGGSGTETNHITGDASIMTSSTGGDGLLIGGDGSGENRMFGDGMYTMTDSAGGNDRLVSGTGHDYMWGDGFEMVRSTRGADTFVFHENNGTDDIYDFENGKDHIEVHMPGTPLLPMAAVAFRKLPLDKMSDEALSHIVDAYDFSDLQIEEVNGSSVVHFNSSDSVTVYGVMGLTASDFLFA